MLYQLSYTPRPAAEVATAAARRKAVTRVNRVTSVGFSFADPLAGVRPLFEAARRLLAQSSHCARELTTGSPTQLPSAPVKTRWVAAR